MIFSNQKSFILSKKCMPSHTYPKCMRYSTTALEDNAYHVIDEKIEI